MENFTLPEGFTVTKKRGEKLYRVYVTGHGPLTNYRTSSALAIEDARAIVNDAYDGDWRRLLAKYKALRDGPAQKPLAYFSNPEEVAAFIREEIVCHMRQQMADMEKERYADYENSDRARYRKMLQDVIGIAPRMILGE